MPDERPQRLADDSRARPTRDEPTRDEPTRDEPTRDDGLRDTRELPVLALPPDATEEIPVVTHWSPAPQPGWSAQQGTGEQWAPGEQWRAGPWAAEQSAGQEAVGERQAALATGRSRRRNGVALVVFALIGSGIGVSASLVARGQGGAPTPKAAASPSAPASSAAGTPATAAVSSFDPAGTGFSKRGKADALTWRTETYKTAQFGRLKPGVGLVLDLGSPQTLSSVTFEAQSGPLTVELRAADDPPTSADAMQRVGDPVQASGATTLPASSGGAHRYWMVWVTQLGPRGGGFGATVTQPVAHA